MATFKEQFANFEWQSRWHANPSAVCTSLDECGDEISLVFCAGVIKMTQEDRKHVANQLRVAAELLDPTVVGGVITYTSRSINTNTF